jgi:acetylornithine deacetylase/succinyl-diaminopimelate desuccinylase-like protein
MSTESLSPELGAWVETHATRLVDEWRACCAVPSVSADGPAAVAEMAAWLTAYATPLFDRFEFMRAPESAAVLLGTLEGTGPARLLSYTHYDVVPAGAGWTRDPFGAELAGDAVYARGAGDDKADVMARLHAIQAWKELRGTLPFTLLWLSEGMEEVGSPGLREVIAENLDRLQADACLWESYYRSVDGESPTIGFGSRGVLNVELSVRLLDADTHSAMAGVYKSSAMILAQAVGSLMDQEGRVLIPGFYDSIIGFGFDSDDAEVVARTPAPPVAPGAAERGALWSTHAQEATRRWLYEPTLNVAAFHAGPEGGGSDATVLPACASARLDLRLMPSQDPQEILASLRGHFDSQGYPEVEIRLRNAIRPARSPLDSPLAMAVRQASSELFSGAQPLLHPVVPGSGPLHLFTDAIPLSAVMPPGTIRPDSGMHGPDENAMVSHYLDEVKLTLRIFELLSMSTEFGKAGQV